MPCTTCALVACLALAAVLMANCQTNIPFDLAGANFYTSGTASMSTVSLGTGGPAATALRISVASSTLNVWDNGVQIRTTLPSGGVPEGHWYLVKFSVRQVAGQANFPAGQGVQGVLVFRPLYPDTYSNSLETTYPCDSTSWCDYSIAFKASDTHTNANPPGFMFQWGEGPQTFDIAITSLQYYGATQPPSSLYKFYYPGRGISTAAWKVSANQRIENVRKAPLNVKVVDSNGNAISGASVKVLQQRHEFPLGTAVDHWTIADNSNPTYKAKILEYFNYIVLENGLKQVYWEADNGASSLSALSWAASNNLTSNGHVILWPGFHYDYTPQRYWTMGATELRNAIYAHVDDIITRTRPYIHEWDVINEPLDNYDVQGQVASPGVTQSNGVLGNSFSADLFDYCWSKLTAGGNPKTPQLVVNDYHVVEGTNNLRRQYTINFVADIRSRTSNIHGFGLQSHVGHMFIPMDTLQSRLNSILAVDAAMKASVTELDMDTFDEQLQADYLEDYVRFFFSQPRVRRILQWGFWEGLHYCPQCALFRTNWQAKPAGARYLDLVFKQWWTNATAATNATGFASVRSFYGQHQVTASYGGVSRTVPVTLSSAQQGATVTIQLNTAPASASPTPTRAAPSPSPTRTPTPTRAAASPSSTRTPTPTRVPPSASPTRTPTPTRVPASTSPTRTPTPTRAAASVSPTRTRTPSPTRPSTPTVTTTGPHSVSPSTATPGSTITVTTRVNVGSTAIVNGKVGYHLSPEGEYVDTNNIAKQWVDFSLGAFVSQTFTFTTTIAPMARAGRYWLTVIVWDANWDNIAWNTDLAILTVYPPEPTIDRVSLTTNPVARGGSTTITFHVNTATTAYTNAKVGFSFAVPEEIQEKIVEEFWEGDLAARTSYVYTFDATIPSDTPVGNYNVNIGLWNANWEGEAWSESYNPHNPTTTNGVTLVVQ